MAAVLIFGKDEVIRLCCPGYVAEAIYRVEHLDRYDDMIKVTANLIEAYEILMEYIAKHTSDKFFLINNVNTSVRDLLPRVDAKPTAGIHLHRLVIQLHI